MDRIFCCASYFQHEAVEINSKKDEIFKVYGQCLKQFLEFQANEEEEAMILHEPQYLNYDITSCTNCKYC